MTSATGAAGQLTIDGTIYHLERAPQRRGMAPLARVRGQFGSGDVTEEQLMRDVPRLYDDFSGGGGYSRRMPEVPNGYAWCVGDTRYPRVFLPAGRTIEIPLPGVPLADPAIPYDSFDYTEGSTIVLLAGRNAFGISTITGGAGLAGVFPSGGTATKAVRHGQYTYISVSGGSPDRIWRFNHVGGGFIQSATVPMRWLAPVYWVVGGLGAKRLIGIGPQDALYVWPSDPSAPGDPMDFSTWSAPYALGDATAITQNLVASASHVYPIRQDGLHDIDGRGFSPNLTPYWNDIFDTTNGWAATVQGDYVYASTAYGLDRVRIGSGPERDRPEWCGPGVGTPNETPVFGQVRALCPYNGGIFAAVDNGVESWICWGISRDQPNVPPGPGPMLWHMALARLTGVTITHLKVHTMGVNQNSGGWLFMAGVDAASALRPRCFRMCLGKSGTPMQIYQYPERYGFGPYEWETSASITLPVDDWGDATALKTMRRFDIQAEGLGEAMSQTYLDVFAKADQEAYESQGRVTVGRETLIPSEGVATGFQIGARVDLTGTTSQPAFLRALKMRAAVSIDVAELRVYRIALGQMTEGLNRGRDRRDPEVLFAKLWGLQMRGPIAMRDHHGRDLQVKIENVASEEVEVPGSAGRRWAMVAVVTLSVLLRPGYWQASPWSIDSTWSGPDTTPAPPAARTNGTGAP